MARDSLVKFSNAILDEAQKQKNRLLEKVKNENIILIKKQEKCILQQKNIFFTTEVEKLKNEKNLKLSLYNYELKVSLIKMRNKLFTDMFDEIEKKIIEYTKTNLYYSNLRADFFKAKNFIQENIFVVSALNKDINFLKSLSDKEFTIEEVKDIIGGFTVTCPQKRIYLDYTLKTILEEEKKLFILNSGFFID